MPLNMVFDPSATDERFGVIDRMMFPIPYQGPVPSKRIRVIDRSFPRLGLDMLHQFVGTHRLDDFGVDAVFPLQETKHDAFTDRGSSAALALTFAAKVRFIQLDLPFKFPPFQLGQMVQRFAQPLVDPRGDLDIHAQVLRQLIGPLQLIEPLQDRNLSPQATQAFALPTELTFHMPTTGVLDLKGATKNAIAAAEKIGRTTKNRALSSNHTPVLAHHGYETP